MEGRFVVGKTSEEVGFVESHALLDDKAADGGGEVLGFVLSQIGRKLLRISRYGLCVEVSKAHALGLDLTTEGRAIRVRLRIPGVGVRLAVLGAKTGVGMRLEFSASGFNKGRKTDFCHS